MFGLSLKERTAEAVRRASMAATIGGYLHHTEVDALGLNDAASACLWHFSVALQIDTLLFIFGKTKSGRSWKTLVFFVKSAQQGINDGEHFNGLKTGVLSSNIFGSLGEIHSIPQSEQSNRFLISAMKIKALDATANTDTIADLLRITVEKYFRDAYKMFEG